MTGRIVRINVSAGGVPKRPVRTARVTLAGLEGDGHRNRKLHGGPDRALCLFSLEQIEALQAEGHPVEPGALGENLTVTGLDWPRVRPGDLLRLGETVLTPAPARRRRRRPRARHRDPRLSAARARAGRQPVTSPSARQ